MASELKRSVGLGLMVFYGVGVMVGAGVYVLIGAVAGAAGVYAPLAFLAAGLVAAPTALSYAELSSRFPEAAGEAAYVESAFQRPWLVWMTGLCVVVVGSISAAAVMRGGIAYLNVIVSIDNALASVLIGGALVAVALVGVLESLALAAVFTLVEVLGLLAVAGAGFMVEPSADWQQLGPPQFSGVAMGGVLAFFAFIGFEDMVNIAEETRDPERTLPRGIIIALLLTTLLYALVSWSAVRALGIDELANSEQPLALLWERSTGGSAQIFSVIAVVAALNGILAQVVMAARVLMGMGRRYPSMAFMASVNARSGTPVLATLCVGVLIVALSIAAPVLVLAEATSTVLLLLFVLINGSLIRIKLQQGRATHFNVPLWVPAFGVLGSVLALVATAVFR